MKGVATYLKGKSISFLILSLPLLLHSQDWSGNEIRTFDKNWTLNINAGLTSFYGDLSIYDNDFVAKLQHESNYGLGAIMTKHLSPTFGFSGQILLGELKGQKNNFQMKSNIIEYNLHARINFVELFSGNRYLKLGITGYAGIGNFLFMTKLSEYYEGGVKETKVNARVPEFIYFFGGGISYQLSDKMDLTMELTIKQCENDKVDGIVANNEYDYYSYFSIGFSYKINNLFQSYTNQKPDRLVQIQEKQKPIYRPNLNYH
ncbi:MAG: hypothetical protein KQI35_00570 [Bacteroidetes bacterium]|nr:hypothetical protein [Bacteroidota bacterium]